MNDSLFDLLEFTQRSLFLTGKAGTGKTTFLNEFVRKTQKKYMVVAPTGIAAINAGGVTIHSMFGLPLRTFIPTMDRIDQTLANNIPDLMHHFKYRKDKLKLLRELEILIIDEVSMLRADVLDMMDFSLRHVRRNQQKFGGVQMLFIGDLYQLPPVVRDENVLKQFYASPFFFDSYALKDTNLITVELTKVYRQTDEKFLSILNDIRDGNVYDVDFDELNKRYIPDFEPKDETYVYLTSHNKMADDINQSKLKELGGKSFFYDAKVIGNFKENQYPNEEKIELREGTQVMFIRNDASGERKYYNGKLAEVVHLDEEEIWVRIEGEEDDYKLKREIWENKAYTLDADKNIKEESLGSFEQFPIRLAWAVTIHKSQGLTFDRLIIDAGKSFASGQVYVALSRCRTLEGIVLKSKITSDVIFSDHRVESFQTETNANDRVDQILEAEKYDYAIRKVLRKADCLWLVPTIADWYAKSLGSKVLDKQKISSLHNALKIDGDQLAKVYSKFERVLLAMLTNYMLGKEEWSDVEQKAKGAVSYFYKTINEKIFDSLKELYAETKGVKGLKQYNDDFRVFLDDLKDYLEDLKHTTLLDKELFEGDKSKEVSLQVAKVPSHVLTFQLFESGKMVSEIAKERGLVIETIYGHLAKYADQGLLDIARVVTKDKIKVFEKMFKTSSEVENLNEWKKLLPDDFQFTEIRILLNHFSYIKRNKEN